MRRFRYHRPTAVVLATMLSIVVTIAMCVAVMISPTCREPFKASSAATSSLSSHGTDVLQYVDPRCRVQTSDGGSVVLDTRGIASVPGVQNACFFVHDKDPLIAPKAGGCAENNRRINLVDELPLTDGSLAPGTYAGTPPFKTVAVTSVAPGIDACTLTFDDTITASDLASYDKLLRSQAARVSPTYQDMAKLYNAQTEFAIKTKKELAICNDALPRIARQIESLTSNLAACTQSTEDIRQELGTCMYELNKSPCKKQCKVMMWTDPNWKGIYSAQTFEMPGGSVNNMHDDANWRPQVDKSSALKLQSMYGANCTLTTFYDVNMGGRSSTWNARNNETTEVPNLEKVSWMDDEVSSFKIDVS